MNPTGMRLTQAQVKGHLAIDAIYQDLADAVEAEVLRWATTADRGAPRLPMSARAAILAAVAAVLDGARLPLMAVVMDARQDAIAAAEVGHESLPVDPVSTIQARHEVYRTLGTDRVSVIGQIGSLLATGIARDLAASEIAKRAKSYFSPWFAPRRNVAGQVVRAGRHGAIHSWPGTAGMASQHPRLVMLYQTTEAHGQTIQRIAQRDRLNIRWNVSYQHHETDACDQHAKRDVGMGSGIYPWYAAPVVPTHPRCRCYYSTVEREAGVQVQAA